MPDTASFCLDVIRQWRKFGLIVVVTAVTSSIVAFEPFALLGKLLVDYAVRSQPSPPWLSRILEAVYLHPTPAILVLVAAVESLGIFLLTSAVDACLSWAWMSAGQRMVYDLSAALFHKLQRLSLAAHLRRPIGDSLGRLVQDTWSIYSLAAGVMSPVQALLTLVAIGVISYRLDPRAGRRVIGGRPCPGCRFGRFRSENQEARSCGAGGGKPPDVVCASDARGHSAGSGLWNGSANRQRFHAMAHDAVTVSGKGVLLGGTYHLMTGFLVTSGAALILFMGSGKVLSGAMPLGTLLVFLAYMRTLQTTAESLLKAYSNLKPVQASMERVTEVLDSQELIREAPQAQQLRERSRGHICFEGVHFGYEPGRPVLQGVTLTVRPGETVAIVGGSGAGKTTLVSLIPRFLDPWEGRVTLDGTDVRDIQISSLREQVALVLQEPFFSNCPSPITSHSAARTLPAMK